MQRHGLGLGLGEPGRAVKMQALPRDDISFYSSSLIENSELLSTNDSLINVTRNSEDVELSFADSSTQTTSTSTGSTSTGSTSGKYDSIEHDKIKERFRRFKLTAKKELEKERPMINTSLLENDEMLMYLAEIEPSIVDKFTRRFVGSLSCETCRDCSLSIYNYEDDIGTLLRCKLCHSTIWNTLFFSLCYHASQVLGHIELNTPEPLALEGLPTTLSVDILAKCGAVPIVSDTSKLIASLQANITRKVDEAFKKILSHVLETDQRTNNVLQNILGILEELKMPDPRSSASSTSNEPTSVVSTSAPSTSNGIQTGSRNWNNRTPKKLE